MTNLLSRFQGNEAAATARASLFISCLVLLFCLIGIPLAQASDADEDDEDDGPRTLLQISQAAIGAQVRDHQFVGIDGKKINLSDYAGKPLVISLIFTSCYVTCPQITQSLASSVEVANDALGEDRFNVVTIGFDAEFDKPPVMRSYQRQQGIDFDNWKFLSTNVETVWRLSDDIGFSFAPSPRGFDHLTQTTILDGKGKVFTHIYGEDFPVPQLVEPLKSIALEDGSWKGVKGTLASIIDNVRIACTVYDPHRDAYKFDYSLFIGMLIGFVCIAGTVAFVLREVYLSRKRRRLEDGASNTSPQGDKTVADAGG